MTAMQLSLKNSISTRLFRIVFLIYFFITLCLTVSQMYTEYLHVKQVVMRELKLLTTTVIPGLAKSLWDVDLSQVESTVEVLKSLPIITGIKIEDEEGIVLARVNLPSNEDANRNESRTVTPNTNKSFQYEFDIVYSEKDKVVGKGTFYSSSDVVVGRVKYGFFLIIVNSIIKTLSLWTIFLLVSRQVLAKPLNQLISFIQSIDLEKLDQLKVSIKKRGYDELKIIENTLNEMIRKLIAARSKIDDNAKELAEKNVELEKMDQLKDEFLANTSHELRTPLHGLMGIAHSIQETLPQPEMAVVRSNLDIIVQTGRHLSLLVDDILDFSKLKHQTLHLNRQAVDISHVVDAVFNISRPLVANKTLNLENHLGKNLPPVEADEKRIQQIVQNLVGNAIKFSQDGVISVGAEIKGDMLEISISDSGKTINPGDYNNIFNAFEQLDGSLSRSYGGAGLGLTITRQLVELHGGKINVKEAKNRGNIFSFTLPLTENPEIVIKAPQTVAEPLAPQLELVPIFGERSPDSRVISVLVVDDDIANLQVVFNYLAFRNYNVVCVQSGPQALQWVEINGAPDLVLLDIMMPEMNGFEVCKILRQRFSMDRLPIIFLTASHRRKDVDSGFKLGANDYLTKPFEQSELLYRIRVHLKLLMAKRQLRSLKDCANQISSFKSYDQMLNFAIDKMKEIKFVTDAAVSGEKNGKSAQDTHTGTLIQFPGEAFEGYRKEQEELIVINDLQNNDSIHQFYLRNLSMDISGNHLILVMPSFTRDSIAILYRSKERLPFGELDVTYVSNMLDQIRTNKINIQTMISDQLLSALSEIQPALSAITHISANAPYCSVHFENQAVDKEFRVSLSHLELYFSDKSMVRIHRSTLINPSKVMAIEKTAAGKKKYRYEILLKRSGNFQRVRIGDSYLEKVQNIFPQFFD